MRNGSPSSPSPSPVEQHGGYVSKFASSKIRYEPGLDGIRGISVMAILLYHAEFRITRGGYFSVDAFFVLSGYLITSLLLAELRLTNRINLKQFWNRRARRLLPALFFLIAGVIVYAGFFLRPDQYRPFQTDVIATLFYVANWKMIADGVSYFDQFETSPLRHAWTLAIEEQWYLVWPFIAIAAASLGLTGRTGAERWSAARRRLLWLCGLTGLASAYWMAWLYVPGEDPSRIYFGTDTRAQSILVGAGLGALLSGFGGFRSNGTRVPAIIAGALAFSGTLLVWVQAPKPHAESWVYRGGFLLAALLIAVSILGVTQPGRNPLRSVLGWTPFRWLGQISYGLYLWHWPVYLLLTQRRTGIEGPFLLTAIRLGAIFSMAIFSYYVVELPIRRGALRPKRALAAIPLTVCALLAATFATTWGATPSIKELAAETNRKASEAPSLSGWDPNPEWPRVLIVGDSVAWSLGWGFNLSLQKQERVRVTQIARLYCQLTQGKIRRNDKVVRVENCPDWRDEYQAEVDSFDPDLVLVVTGGWEIFDRLIDDRWLSFMDGELDDYVITTFREAVEILSARGAIVLLMTSPYLERDSEPIEWTRAGRPRIDRFNRLLRTIALRTSERTQLIDAMAFVCPDGECLQETNGKAVRYDGVHFLPLGGASMMARWLLPQFRSIYFQRQLHARPGRRTQPAPRDG